MSLLDEIKAAEFEIATSFSQKQWEDAIIECWKANGSVGDVLYVVSGKMSIEKDGGIALAHIVDRASQMRPPLSVQTRSFRQPVRAWLDRNARNVSNCFWDGDFDAGRRLMIKSKSAPPKAPAGRLVREIIRNEDKDMRGLYQIKVRERDKSTDWKTCK